MPVRLSSNNYSAADCPRAACRRQACPVRGRPAGRPAWTWPASLSAGRDVRLSDRQTVCVIYVHSILSVLLARRVPGRLLALIKKSAHEMVDPVLHVSILPHRDSILSPIPISHSVSSSLCLHPLGLFIRPFGCISSHETRGL